MFANTSTAILINNVLKNTSQTVSSQTVSSDSDNSSETETEIEVVRPNDVTPFDVTVVTDYNKLVTEFGCIPLSQDLFDRFEKVTGTMIPACYKKFIISHRDLDVILDAIERHEQVYLYTGRGPSSERMHLGHLVPFRFCQFLQTALNVPVVIQLTDDEKFIFKDNLTMEMISKMVEENIRDIIACGFDPEKTFIFTNSKFIGQMYPMILKIQKIVKLKQVVATFGFPIDGENTSIGKVAFPAVQAAPAFAETFEGIFEKANGQAFNLKKVYCLVPCAIDQDPYFRMCRGIAAKLKHHKPAVIHTRFLPSLDGVETKMSASNPSSCIYLGDSEKQVRKKIGKGFSGGQEFLEDHKRLGGNPEKDVAYSLLEFFASAGDPDFLSQTFSAFKSGSLSCGEMKRLAGDTIAQVVSDFKKKRSEITLDCVRQFTCTVDRKINF